MVVVGGPIGTDDYIAEFISKEVERKQKVLPYVLAFASTQRPPSTDSNFDLANTPHHHSQHESNLTSRAEWSVQKGYDETWLHDDDSMDGHFPSSSSSSSSSPSPFSTTTTTTSMQSMAATAGERAVV